MTARTSDHLLKCGRSQRAALFICGAFLSGAYAGQSSPDVPTKEAGEYITVDDLLSAESLGAAWFAPTGSAVMFARTRAAKDIGQRGFADASLGSTRLFVVDGAAAPEEIASPGMVVSSVLGQPWAPDGNGVLTLAASNGTYRFAFWDRRHRRLTVLPGRPPSSVACFAWLGRQIAYPTVAEAAMQPHSFPQVLQGLNERWQSTWSGKRTAVTVSSTNPVFASTTAPVGHLMLATPSTGEGRVVAEGDYMVLEVAPDGSRLAAVRLAEDIAHPLYPTGRRGELQIFRVEADALQLEHTFPELDVQSLVNLTAGSSPLAWAPNSRSVLVGGKRKDEDVAQARLFRIDVTDGASVEIPGSGLVVVDSNVHVADSLVQTGWAGTIVMALAGAPSESQAPQSRAKEVIDYGEARNLRFDLYALTGQKQKNLTAFAQSAPVRRFIPRGEGSALVIADGKLWDVGASGRRRALSDDLLGRVLDFAVDDASYVAPAPSAYWRARGQERVALLVARNQDLARVVLDLKTSRVLNSQPAAAVVAASPDLLQTLTRASNAWETSYHLSGPAEREVARANERLRSKPVLAPTRFDYSSGGKDYIGWVLLPPPALAKKPLPAIVMVYGGTIYGSEPPAIASTRMTHPVLSGQLLAAQGYGVIYPSTPLDAGATTDLMNTLAEQAVAAVDALVSQGIVDRARVGVLGQSFGGYSTAAILAKRSDRFRAGVSLAGAYDWIGTYGSKALSSTLSDDGRVFRETMLFAEVGNPRLRRPFWEDSEPYIRNSPIFHVQELDSPLLMLQGDLDLSVTSLQGAERMYNALVRAGKQPTLVHYWGEGHVAESEWALRDQWARTLEWFAVHLQSTSDQSVHAVSSPGPHAPGL